MPLAALPSSPRASGDGMRAGIVANTRTDHHLQRPLKRQACDRKGQVADDARRPVGRHSHSIDGGLGRQQGDGESMALLEAIYAAASGATAGTVPRLEIQLDATASPLSWFQSTHFVEQYFERWPLLLRAGSAGQMPLPELDQLAALGLCRLTGLGHFVYEMDKRAAHHRTVALVDGSFDSAHPSLRPGDALQPAELQAMLKAGWTAIFDGVQLFLPEVAELTLQLSAIFDRKVNANIYVAAAGLQQAMCAHNDLQCTFVLQVAGSKTWEMWPNAAALGVETPAGLVGKTLQRRLDRRRLGTPALTVTLQPGDVLYCPRGCIHATSTTIADDERGGDPGDVDSVHSTVHSVHITSGLDNDLLPAEALAEAAVTQGPQIEYAPPCAHHRRDHFVAVSNGRTFWAL